MNKVVIVLCGMLFLPYGSKAQGVNSELYLFNYTLIHPSFAGLDEQKISFLGSLFRYQTLSGYETSTLGFVNYERRLNKLNSGIAVTGFSTVTGPIATTSLGISYNYQHAINDKVVLIPGIRFRWNSSSLSLSYFSPGDDPLLVTGSTTESSVNADVGMLVQVDKLKIGVMVDNLFPTRTDIHENFYPGRYARTYTAVIGMRTQLSKVFAAEHSLYLPVSDGSYRVDLNNSITWKKLLTAGTSVELRNGEFYTRFNGGVNVKDYFRVMALLYSTRRNDFFYPALRAEVYMEFKF
jgi:type IX secretion system PorP/SprF family membrane protein